MNTTCLRVSILSLFATFFVIALTCLWKESRKMNNVKPNVNNKLRKKIKI